jgi:23S rRNA (guanosine2251-2'-O)-methyltransferase
MSNVIFGHHSVAEAIEAGASIEKILLRQGLKPERIFAAARKAGLPIQFVPEIKLEKLTKGGNHQGVVALIAPIRYHKLEDIILAVQKKEKMPFFIMLDGITDVRNFGAIARTAECLGVDAIIIPRQGAASVNADAVKTSAGALMHIPVCREDVLLDSLLMLQAYSIFTYAVTEKAKDSLYSTNLKGSCCLILGSEDKGISAPLLKRADYLIKIPMTGQVESLNVSVAAAITIAEAARQRG